MRSIFLALVAAVATWSPAARAEFDLKLYRELMRTPETKEKLSDYVTGLGRGIFYANAFLEVRESAPLFCMPGKLSLDQGLIESLLDQEIRKPASGNEYPDDTPIELIMVRAFMTRFPCEGAA